MAIFVTAIFGGRFFSLYEFILKDVNKSKKVKRSLYSKGKKKENKKKNIQIGT